MIIPTPNKMPEDKFVHLLFNWGFDNGYTFLNSEMSDLYNRLSADLAPTSQWRDIDDLQSGKVVLVSRPSDKYIYEPTTAFRDVTGVWRVYRSHGGMTKLSFTPTHYIPLPAPPTKDLAAAEKEKV